MDHRKLYEAAKDAIDRVFSDKSVPPSVVRTSLEDLSDHIEFRHAEAFGDDKEEVQDDRPDAW